LLTLAALEPERGRSQADFLWLSLVSWFTDACFSEVVAKKIEILPAFSDSCISVQKSTGQQWSIL
jgi:hypothetical protein